MSKYTAEQVFLRSEDIKYSADIDCRLTPACAADVYEMLTNYAALLRERESAKAAVTDEIAVIALNACRDSIQRQGYSRPVSGPDDDVVHIKAMRSALEAVAPMLASARVPDAMEVDDSLFQTWDHDTYKEYGYALGWNDCRAAMLAAAPKPETEE